LLQLFDPTQAMIASNGGWGASPNIAAAAAAVGAFSWGTTASHDAALDVSLPSGPFTVQISGQSGDTGDALVEIYDATSASVYTSSMPRLVNLSARVQVGTGANALFVGFVIRGSTALTVLIRASGPAIAAAPFVVPGVLPDPQLTLVDQATGATITSNSGWGGNAVISEIATAAGAFAWQNPASHDSALVITLPPGQYTAQVAGSSGDSGVAIAEVYEVP
jgi:hypothetical protein